MPGLQEARAEVEQQFQRACALVEDDGASFFDFERRAWTALLALGRALVVLLLVRRARHPRALQCEHDRRKYRSGGARATPPGTRASGEEPFEDSEEGCDAPGHAGECLHREGSAELRAPVAKQVGRLRSGSVSSVIMALEQHLGKLPRTGPGNRGRRERLDEVLEYLRDNLHRMPHERCSEEDLDLGSGAVEGAVRHLVRVRLDGPGMRWGLEHAERVLHLGCVLLDGPWDEFTQYLAQRPALRLAARPAEAVSHDAKVRAAA